MSFFVGRESLAKANAIITLENKHMKKFEERLKFYIIYEDPLPDLQKHER